MIDYVWLVPAFPLIGVLINGFFGRRIRRAAVGWVACGVMGLSFLVSSLVFWDLLQLPPDKRVFKGVVFTWIASGDLRAEAGFLLDPLSAVMILVVSGVGFLIHVYSVGYMGEDRDYPRYFTHLNLFAFSMLLLVLASNYLLFFVGWELVGLCSYLLIGFWFERKTAADAGKKAFVVNRIGDFGFALGIMLIFVTFGSLDFQEVFRMAPEKLQVGSALATAITLLLFTGAMGKSAQIPLYVWLPDAMEGPTPVSALIHAATMVTAGVYMVARNHVLYELAPFSLALVAAVGMATAFFTASIALVQNDIKRIMAYSTISQLGYMFTGAGVGAYAAGIFHLMTHAFFKALLFLAAGSVMHALANETDIRRMGALKEHIPITFWTMAIATAAIAGIPGLSGFFSKDEILWQAYSGRHGHYLLWLLGVATAALTAFYMFRVLFLTFLGESRVDPHLRHHIHESPPIMTVPLMILAFLSIVGGYLGVPEVLGGANRFQEFLAPVFEVGHAKAIPSPHGAVGLELGLMGVSVAAALVGIGVAYRFYIQDPSLPHRLAERFQRAYTALLNKYYVDEIYETLIVNPFKRGSVFLWEGFDVKVVDGSVNGVAYLVEWGGSLLRKVQTGYVFNYVLAILAGAVAIVGYMAFWR
ncbi:MAG: NADH-quinone oxidoreductase subunit L [candidate division NC10 bacterium]|nr:NADH-quinone oxidoreductase subunit L [candidate division NC10 bacterium]